MTRNRKLKDAVRAYQAPQNDAGRTLTYQQALAEYTTPRPARLVPTQRVLVLTTLFDAPPRRDRPCPDCNGLGVGDEQLLTGVDPGPDGTPRFLAVEMFCITCGGCGQAGHDQCPPASHPVSGGYEDELRELEDGWFDDLELELEDEPCASCGPHRPGWNVHHIALGDPDNPERQYAAWVRMPCSCAQDRTHPLDDVEAARLLDALPAEADPRWPGEWTAAFTGPRDLPFPVNETFLSGLGGRPHHRLHRRREDDEGRLGDTVDVFALIRFDTDGPMPIGRYEWLGAGTTEEELAALADGTAHGARP